MSTDSRRERIATAAVGHLYASAAQGLARLAEEYRSKSQLADTSAIEEALDELPSGAARKAVEIADALIAELDKPFDEIACEHEWVSADNEVVTGCEICIECKEIRAALPE